MRIQGALKTRLTKKACNELAREIKNIAKAERNEVNGAIAYDRKPLRDYVIGIEGYRGQEELRTIWYRQAKISLVGLGKVKIAVESMYGKSIDKVSLADLTEVIYRLLKQPYERNIQRLNDRMMRI